MIAEIITRHGTRRLARLCGVTAGAVHEWKRLDRLPQRQGPGMDRYRAHYTRVLARLEGMKVGEFRSMLEESNNASTD